MNLDSATTKKIEELQLLEKNLQNFLLQKQSFQVELNEVVSALTLLATSDDEVYKIVGEVMIKSDKKTVIKDLEEKKKSLELRISSFEKQEKSLAEKANKLRNEVSEVIAKQKK